MSAVLSGPGSTAAFECPDCQTNLTVAAEGTFACDGCRSVFRAEAHEAPRGRHRFVIARHRMG